MTEFWRFLGIAAAAAAMTMTLRSAHREMGAALAVVCGAVLLMLLTEKLGQAVGVLTALAQRAAIEGEHAEGIVKALGISLAAEFAAQACRDAGEEGIALRVEMGGKLMLAVLAMPLLEEIAQVIMELTG